MNVRHGPPVGRWQNTLLKISLLLWLFLLSNSNTPAETGSQAWVQRYSNDTGADDRALKVTTDSVGNIVVAGKTDEGGTNGVDMLLIKYSAAGVPLWTN